MRAKGGVFKLVAFTDYEVTRQQVVVMVYVAIINLACLALILRMAERAPDID